MDKNKKQKYLQKKITINLHELKEGNPKIKSKERGARTLAKQ